ncbi:hypothetical protein BJV82DRAFT_642816 [Fennellomyces sp. T-0311]|nr:hypothetical protein BJV82DRAFT_642816 [Fennellomyces sp. T-0311]
MTTLTATVTKGKKPYKSWLKDGVNGGMSSMDVLVSWLSDKANYSKWRGGDNNSERTPKKLLLEEIIERMRQVGIYHRLPKDVASKISTLQSNYRTAREWNDTEGKRLRQAGAKEEIVHEEILKRFPYWDSLHGSFGNFRTSPSWPMSISSIMDEEEKPSDRDDSEEESSLPTAVSRRRRRMSDSHLLNSTAKQPRFTPVTRATPATDKRYDAVLAESLLQVTREKEAGRMKRSQDMLEFLREKRLEREQLLIEQERTRRIRAKAELVKNLMDAGFTKQEIADQLQFI